MNRKPLSFLCWWLLVAALGAAVAVAMIAYALSQGARP